MSFRFGPLQPSPLKISFVLETCSVKETVTVLETLEVVIVRGDGMMWIWKIFSELCNVRDVYMV